MASTISIATFILASASALTLIILGADGRFKKNSSSDNKNSTQVGGLAYDMCIPHDYNNPTKSMCNRTSGPPYTSCHYDSFPQDPAASPSCDMFDEYSQEFLGTWTTDLSNPRGWRCCPELDTCTAEQKGTCNSGTDSYCCFSSGMTVCVKRTQTTENIETACTKI